jgi:hypothetical protein
MTSRYVIFDKHKYDILPQCIVFEWWDKGIIGMIFPQWVATLEFSHYSRFPHDPNTLEPAIISSEVRNAMNKEEWLKSYAKSFTPPQNKKQSFMQQWLPFISIILVVIVAFYMYNQIQATRNVLNDVVNQIGTYLK